MIPALDADGAFPSILAIGDERIVDGNACVTALVLLERPELRCEPALAFLARCAGDHAWHFYPPGHEPARLGARLPADADDTALVATVLADRGELSPGRRDAAIAALEPYRLLHRPAHTPAWVPSGAYRTWLSSRSWPNPVDAVVNANLASFFASVDRLDHPGARAAAAAACAAVAHLERAPGQIARVAPYYPEPRELGFALARGAARGVPGFAGAARRLAALALPAGAPPALCASPTGRWRWFAPALEMVRLARSPLGG